MFTVNYENAATYKTMFIAACHCNVDQWRQLLALADDKAAFYCHRTTQSNDTGIIVRLDPIGDDIGDEYIENEYFDLSGRVYCMADFMRIGDGGMADYGFIGVMGESNTSALYISLSDNSDFVNVVRVIG